MLCILESNAMRRSCAVVQVHLGDNLCCCNWWLCDGDIHVHYHFVVIYFVPEISELYLVILVNTLL